MTIDPAWWAAGITTLLILLIFAIRPIALRYADRHRWRREHKNEHKEQPR